MKIDVIFCYIYIINASLGSGFISIPYLFYKAGTIISAVTFILYCAVSLICAIYIIETLGRVKVIDKKSLSETESLPILNSTSNRDVLFLHSQNRKYEVSESGQILFGWWANLIITLMLFCSIITATWAYCALSGSILSTNIPVDTTTFQTCNASEFIKRLPTQLTCLNLYRVCVAGFGITVLFLSVIGLNKQKYLQLMLGIVRFIVLISIILFSLVKIFLQQIYPQTFDTNSTNSSVNLHNDAFTYLQTLLKIDMLYIFYGIPIILYCLQNHVFLPTALFTVTDKKLVKNITIAVFLTLGMLLVTLGISVSLAFSHSNNPNCVLNWIPYTHDNYHISLRIFSYIVIFFPVVDLLSVFPLQIIIQANMVFLILTRTDTSQIKTFSHNLLLTSIRCGLALLPILLSLFAANLIVITDISGVFSIALTLCMPVLFQWRSQRLVKLDSVEQPNTLFARTKLLLFSTTAHTPYSGWYSGLFVQMCVGVISVVSLLIAIASIILYIMHDGNSL